MRTVGIDPTGSTWDRTAACPASAALPQVFDGYGNDYRDKGIGQHSFLDRVAQLRRDGIPLDQARETALTEAPDQWRAACEQIDLEQIGHRLTLSTEVAVAYNWRADTARILTPVAPRQYEIDPDSEVAQTLDACGVNMAERVVSVGDFKGPYAWLPEPSKSLQLGGGALSLARIYRARTAHVEFIRLRTDGTVLPWRATLDVFAIEAVATRIQTMMHGVEELRGAIAQGVVPNVTEGRWCSYCPAKTHCPAKTQLVRSVLAGDAKHKLSLREPITKENVGDVYRMLKKVKEAVGYTEKAVRAYEADGAPSTPEGVSESAIPVGTDADGSLRYFGRFERDGNEKIDGEIALDVLRGKYGDAALEAFEVETSKEAIESVVRANKPADVTLKAAKEEVLDAIRAAGGAKRAPTDKPTEFIVSPEGKAKKATSRRKAS